MLMTNHCDGVAGEQLGGGQHREVGEVRQQVDDGHLQSYLNTLRDAQLSTYKGCKGFKLGSWIRPGISKSGSMDSSKVCITAQQSLNLEIFKI